MSNHARLDFCAACLQMTNHNFYDNTPRQYEYTKECLKCKLRTPSAELPSDEQATPAKASPSIKNKPSIDTKGMSTNRTDNVRLNVSSPDTKDDWIKTAYQLARAATGTEEGRQAIDFFYHVHLSSPHQATPTALSSIDEIKKLVGKFLIDSGCSFIADPLYVSNAAAELTHGLEAHIAEHYVPKAEVKELDEILYDLANWCAKTAGVSNDQVIQAKQQIEALITQATINELQALNNDGSGERVLQYVQNRIAQLRGK